MREKPVALYDSSFKEIAGFLLVMTIIAISTFFGSLEIAMIAWVVASIASLASIIFFIAIYTRAVCWMIQLPVGFYIGFFINYYALTKIVNIHISLFVIVIVAGIYGGLSLRHSMSASFSEKKTPPYIYSLGIFLGGLINYLILSFLLNYQ